MATAEELKARLCAEIDRRKGEIVAISEHIMRHPEAGYREARTAEYVAGWFGRMGLGFREGLALTGVKARLRGRSRGTTVAVLGELDSLIVAEHPLADPATHAAHACGHNAQVASIIGAGMGLQAVMDELDGDVVFFAVPAEEYTEVEWRLGLREEAHPRAGGVRGTIHGADYLVVDHVLAAVNPAKAMAMTVVDLLCDGARDARRIKAEAGPKLSREEYLALVRRFGSFEEYPGA